MSTLHFEFIAQDHIVYEDDVNMVIIPGAAGVIGVLPKHAPLMAVVNPGEVMIRKEGEEDQYFAVGDGFVEVRPDGVTLLARSGERAEDIDVARAEAALRRAQEYLTSPERDRDRERRVAMENALRRSRVRLQLARRRRRRRSSRGSEFGTTPSSESRSES